MFEEDDETGSLLAKKVPKNEECPRYPETPEAIMKKFINMCNEIITSYASFF
jgi:hypothetical protein